MILANVPSWHLRRCWKSTNTVEGTAAVLSWYLDHVEARPQQIVRIGNHPPKSLSGTSQIGAIRDMRLWVCYRLHRSREYRGSVGARDQRDDPNFEHRRGVLSFLGQHCLHQRATPSSSPEFQGLYILNCGEIDGFNVNAQSLQAGLATFLLIAFGATQAVAQESEFPKWMPRQTSRRSALRITRLPELSAISCLLSRWER